MLHVPVGTEAFAQQKPANVPKCWEQQKQLRALYMASYRSYSIASGPYKKQLHAGVQPQVSTKSKLHADVHNIQPCNSKAQSSILA